MEDIKLVSKPQGTKLRRHAPLPTSDLNDWDRISSQALPGVAGEMQEHESRVVA